MRKGKIARRIGGGGILALVVAVLLPSLAPCPSLNGDLTYSGTILDRNGKLLRISLTPDGKYRIRIHSEDLPQGLVDSILLHEDQSFRKHRGVDFLAVCRATLERGLGRSESGASTISMQLARMRFGIQSHTWSGKLEQAFRALQLERHYSKDELIESYLNRASYGGNIEGIAAASLIYFGKAPKQLTQPEWDALALIPQRPASRGKSTAGTETPDLFHARKRLTARRLRADAEIVPLYFQRSLPFEAPHLAVRLQRNEFAENLRTTLDLRLQKALEAEIEKGLRSASRLGVRNAAALLVDYQTGETLSYVGSANFASNQIQGQVDGVTMRRSPGSTVKPFIYATALQEGLIHPGSLIADSPISLGSYQPENFDRRFEGKMKVSSALVQSRNIPAVLLAARLRPSTRTRILSWLGNSVTSDIGAGMAVGGFETSMEKLVSLWCALANHGESVPLHYIAGGEATNSSRLFSKEASFLVLNMLASKENYHPLLPAGSPIAWKTGTSQGFRDAWCCAVFDRYVLCVWLGAFDGKPNPALIGRELAAPLLFRMISRTRELSPAASDWLRVPEEANLERVQICEESGLLCGPECSAKRTEWFWPGVSPVVRCKHSAFASAGAPLQIESPASAVRYVAERKSNRGIPLRTSATNCEVYWFDGARFLGSSRNNEPVWWQPGPGNYRLLAVDETGQSVCREVRVIGL